MNPHFFTAPFYFAFIWFRVQGSGFGVQDCGGGFAAFFRRWYSRIAAFPSRECYSVKWQNVLGSPSGELPGGLRGQHYGISNIVRWPLACPYCLRHVP